MSRSTEHFEKRGANEKGPVVVWMKSAAGRCWPDDILAIIDPKVEEIAEPFGIGQACLGLGVNLSHGAHP